MSGLSRTKGAASSQSRVHTSEKSSHCRSASVCDEGYTGSGDFIIPSLKKSQGLGTTALKKSILVNKYKKMGKRYT